MAEVSLIEVGPRDGLQNESKVLPTSSKAHFISLLQLAGLKRIEATSFVPPKNIPQMADAIKLCSGLASSPEEIIALAPNRRGLEDALDCGLKSVALIVATSNTFNQKNINSSTEEAMDALPSMIKLVHQKGGKVRVHLSTSFGCPYEGAISQAKVLSMAKEIFKGGSDEIVLADTIGVATPRPVTNLLKDVARELPPQKVTLHFHDTRGMGVVNVLTALEKGFTSFDSSAGGIGGCPYAPGASGNVATEELVYLFDHLGVSSAVDLNGIFKAVEYIIEQLGRKRASKLFNAHRGKEI